MTTQVWTIVEISSGEVLAPCFITGEPGQHPKDAGFAWDETRHKAVEIAAAPDLAAQSWTGEEWADDPALVEPVLIARIKAEAERRKMQMLSEGTAKQIEYAEKRQEVIAFDTSDADQVPDDSLMFAHAIADAAANGDTLADAIGRFRRGIANAAGLPVIAAIEAVACSAVRAAATVNDKTAAADVIWPDP